MADRSFEEQVQQELLSLRMKPDSAVWQGVEAALRKENKRRWIIWFFLFAGLAGASAWGYLHFDQTKNKQQLTTTANGGNTKTEQKKQAIISIKKDKNIVQQNEIVIRSVPVSKNNTALLSVENLPGSKLPAPGKKVQRKKEIKEITELPVSQSEKKTNIAIENKQETKEIQSKENKTENKTEKITGKYKYEDGATGSSNESQSVLMQHKDSSTVAEVKEDKKAAVENPIVQPVSSNDSSTLPGKKKKANPWQWKLGAIAGSGGMRNISINRAAAFSLASPNNSTTPPTAVPAIITPIVSDAFSYGIHVEAVKRIGAKSSIGISAGYTLFQTSTTVGRRVDSVYSGVPSTSGLAYSSAVYSNYYYTSTDSSSYTNRYHFLQLGANLYTPFRLFSRVSLQWQLGAGLDFLVATNGLHYDPATAKLFSNNSLYAKMQTYVSTGIDIAIGKEPFLYIGPHVQYHLTKLTQQNNIPQHLFLSAVKISFVLPKKKK